jgi:3-hydroxyisobutyrate dehydrogenase
VHVKTAIGAHAAEIYQRFAQAGHSGMDFSGIINFVREASK